MGTPLRGTYESALPEAGDSEFTFYRNKLQALPGAGDLDSLVYRNGIEALVAVSVGVSEH
jgi:hypothetical protein